MIYLFSLLVASSPGSVLGKLCSGWIADYPFPYEGLPTEYICREIDRMKIRELWGRLDEQTKLKQALDEMARRSETCPE